MIRTSENGPLPKYGIGICIVITILVISTTKSLGTETSVVSSPVTLKIIPYRDRIVRKRYDPNF